jgi:large subunit ribosomal protein L23
MSLFSKTTEDTKKTTPVSEEAIKGTAKKAKTQPVVKVHPKGELHVIQPLMSEKAMILSESNTYVFLIKPQTNKSEIKKEIENLYKVDVVKVTTSNYPDKTKHYRGLASKERINKKAMVTVKKGQKIELFNK